MAATYDRCTAAVEAAGLADWRRELLADVTGEVVELGAGTGHNMCWYSSAVDRLVLTEPDPHMRTRLEARVVERRQDGDGPGHIEVLDRHGDALGLADGSADAVVATLVLCSVPDPDAVLAEIRRVLRPGGRFAYLEHVAAIDAPRDLRWQRFFEPVWKRLAGNCHLTRSTGLAIVGAGFEVETERRQAMPKAPLILRPTVRGLARRPT
jgi:ubiquinone/menaquinone biosynthesis C-methylase UbiE